jgi:hypothetical protein
MKLWLNIDRIARELGGERRGPVPATRSHFGALESSGGYRSTFQGTANGKPLDGSAHSDRSISSVRGSTSPGVA